jgi:transposase InsO family protein
MSDNEPVEKKETSPPRGGSRAKKIYARSFEERLRAVKLHLEEGFTQNQVASVLGVTDGAVSHWVRDYRVSGEEGLKKTSRRRAPRLPAPVRDKIVELKKENPTFGVKRISQFLRRFFLMQASAETVRQKLKEEGLVEPPPKPRRNLVRPRFFERATPNQMWQSDIFTFKVGLRYAYLIGFMDDYSRFMVGAGLFHSQTSENVLEVFRGAVAAHKAPREMLTDNGRQYATWRGKTRFQKELQKENIHHIRSTPHHPMTLGKIERFWATLHQEFLSRALFDSFEQARERIAFWIQYYNFKRPNQGIEGLCPADRFFEVASEVRKTLQAGIQENLLEMALRGQPQKPFYMVGNMQGQSVVLRAEKGKLKLSIDNGNENKELIYDLNQQNQTAAPISAPTLSPGESPGGPGHLDRSLPADGHLSSDANPGHHLEPVAAASHGGNAPGTGIEGELEQRPAPEPQAPIASDETPKSDEHQQTLAPAGADPACQQGGDGGKKVVDDPLREESPSHSTSQSGPDHGHPGSPEAGDLPSGLLQMGAEGPAGAAQITGGPTPGSASLRIGPAEEPTPEAGAGTGKTAAPCPGTGTNPSSSPGDGI